MSPDRKAASSAPRTTRAGSTPSSRTGAKPVARKPPARRPAPGKGRKPRASLPRRLLKWASLALLGAFLLGVAAFVVGYLTTDIPDPNKDFTAQTSFVYYADGKHEIGRFANQNRTSIPLSEVPQHVQDAVIAAEDRSFETNQGIDPKGILRAASATRGATPRRVPRRSPSSTSRSSTCHRSGPSPGR